MTPLPNVHPLIYIGKDEDADRLLLTQRILGQGWQKNVAPGWAIVHAAKSPWHAEMAGYHSGAAPADSPDRWWATRERRIALNLVDSPAQMAELVVPILDQGAHWICAHVDNGLSILVHCNAGLSRSPALVLWWMHRMVPDQSYEEALHELMTDHPYTKTDSGIMKLVKDQWNTR